MVIRLINFMLGVFDDLFLHLNLGNESSCFLSQDGEREEQPCYLNRKFLIVDKLIKISNTICVVFFVIRMLFYG
jgi:hypothetical protein